MKNYKGQKTLTARAREAAMRAVPMSSFSGTDYRIRVDYFAAGFLRGFRAGRNSKHSKFPSEKA